MAPQLRSWQQKLLPESYLDDTRNLSVCVLEVPASCGLLSPEEIRITEKYDAVGLSEQLRTGKLTSKAIVTAFCKRAAIAQQLTNCLTEIFFDQAIARAVYLDEFFEKEGRRVGPLHGIPISLKDSFNLEGIDTTLGFVSFIGNTSTTVSHLVKLLLDLGAILYVKTNVSQALQTADSENNVFGRTLNPYNLGLTPGGSSGGEGALIALRGSILGVGTDLGGSIRIPASCCGLYGFKPSANRIPYGGQLGPAKSGSPAFSATAGPLATTLRDCDFFFKSVVSKLPWNYDCTALAIPWRDISSGSGELLSGRQRLKVGVVEPDTMYPLHPPVKRALVNSVDCLTKEGHSIVYLTNAPTVREAFELAELFLSLDSSQAWLKTIDASSEPAVQSIKVTRGSGNEPKHLTIMDLFDLNVAKIELLERWNEIWVENDLDVIMGPGSQTTAVAHDTNGSSPYMTAWNLLDYSSLVIPVGKADRTRDLQEFSKIGGETPPRALYFPEDAHGLPTSIQLAVRPFHDEELLEAALIADGCLRKIL